MNGLALKLVDPIEEDQSERDAKTIFGGRIVGTVPDLDEEAAKELFEKVKSMTQVEIAWIFLEKEFSLFYVGGPQNRADVEEALNLFAPSKN